MRNKFSTSWKSSKRPGKQRKYAANAPLHTKRKMMKVNLSKELRKSQGKRAVVLRKGDTVLIKRGKFRGKKGKVLMVDLRKTRAEVEGAQIKKQDGSKINVSMKPWNLQILTLNVEDRKQKSASEKIPDEGAKKEKTEKSKKSEKGVKENAS